MKSIYKSKLGKELEESGFIGSPDYWKLVKQYMLNNITTFHMARSMVEFNIIGGDLIRSLEKLNKLSKSIN